ncbi:hypothetical protein D3C72_1676710 [compost metagenome]
MCRGDQGILAPRDVATHAVDRQVLMAQNDAWECLDFDIQQRVLLHLGKTTNLFLGEANIGQRLLRQRGNASVDLSLAQAEILRRPFVKLRGVIPHCAIAPFGDISQDRRDSVAHLRADFRLHFLRLRCFQMLGHKGSSFAIVWVEPR